MKPISKYAFLISLVIPLAAFAVGGGPPSQGVMFSGQGLDWQRTGTETQLYPQGISVPSWPPSSGTYELNAVRITVQGTCANMGGHAARCRATARLQTDRPPSMLCGRWLSEKQDTPLSLYALNGEVARNGSFKFQPPGPPAPPAPPPRQVTFACAPDDMRNVDEAQWAAMGALGKCLAWPLPGGTYGFAAGSREFETCLRVARADYCGDGVSHTKDGTLIDVYKPTLLAGFHAVQPGFFLEANWDPQGAICIVHTRYVALPSACRAIFRYPLNVFQLKDPVDGGIPLGMRGGDYWCRKLGDGLDPTLDRSCSATGPECPWLTKTQQLLQQGFLANDSLIQP